MGEHAAADELLTVAEVAVILRICPDSVVGAIDRGALRAAELDGAGPRARRLRLRRADVDAYAANRRTWKRKLDGWTPVWTMRL